MLENGFPQELLNGYSVTTDEQRTLYFEGFRKSPGSGMRLGRAATLYFDGRHA